MGLFLKCIYFFIRAWVCSKEKGAGIDLQLNFDQVFDVKSLKDREDKYFSFVVLDFSLIVESKREERIKIFRML